MGWSGCHSDGLVTAGVVWSNVTVAPAAICCWDEMVVTTLPVLSTMSVFSVALTAAERLFCTSVLISTVLDEPEVVARVGVVTQVPYQVMCSGSVMTIKHVAIEAALEGMIAREGRIAHSVVVQ